jgi:hypothetical protein
MTPDRRRIMDLESLVDELTRELDRVADVNANVARRAEALSADLVEEGPDPELLARAERIRNG